MAHQKRINSSGWLLHFTWGIAEAKCILIMAICVCACLSLTAFPHNCTDPDATQGNVRGCPLVVHYWADLQLVHRFHCYEDVAPNGKCQWVLVLALCLVLGARHWFKFSSQLVVRQGVHSAHKKTFFSYPKRFCFGVTSQPTVTMKKFCETKAEKQ